MIRVALSYGLLMKGDSTGIRAQASGPQAPGLGKVAGISSEASEANAFNLAQP